MPDRPSLKLFYPIIALLLFPFLVYAVVILIDVATARTVPKNAHIIIPLKKPLTSYETYWIEENFEDVPDVGTSQVSPGEAIALTDVIKVRNPKIVFEGRKNDLLVILTVVNGFGLPFIGHGCTINSYDCKYIRIQIIDKASRDVIGDVEYASPPFYKFIRINSVYCIKYMFNELMESCAVPGSDLVF